MSADHDQLEAILVAALELTSDQERAAYLDVACGTDFHLRQEADALLAAHVRAGTFLEEPVTERYAELLEVSSQAEQGEETLALVVAMLAPSDNPEHLGRLADYEVVRVLGRGGMGIVLEGRDVRLQRPVAIKVLAPHYAANPTSRQRFLREGRAAAAVTHENVVVIYDIGTKHELPYIVMEYVAGETLGARIAREGMLDLAELLRIARQTAQALSAAHSIGVIHRDVSPANILLENGVARVKVVDFGLARSVDDTTITHPGMIVGTPEFASPEQLLGRPMDGRSDLFSLGCVIYAMCTGRSPFRGRTTLEVIRRVCDDTPRPVLEINPAVPDELAQVIHNLLEKLPYDRIRSADEVVQRLTRILATINQPATFSPPDSRGTKVKCASEDRDMRFDPYHKWLGIPAEEQPPTLYRLLGIREFEQDPEVIDHAADRQMSHVRNFGTGPNGPASQKLLNEISAARVTLLDPNRKRDYDTTLQVQRGARQDGPPLPPFAGPAMEVAGPATRLSPPNPGATPQAAVSAQMVKPALQVAPLSPRSASRSYQRRKPSFAPALAMLQVAFGGLAGICVAIVVLWVVWQKDPLGIIGREKVAERSDNGRDSGPPVGDAVQPGASSRSPTRQDAHHPESQRQATGPPTLRSAPTLRRPLPPTTAPGTPMPQREVPGNRQNQARPADSNDAVAKPTPVVSTTAPPSAIAPFDDKRAKEMQRAWAEHLGVPLEYENSIGMKLVLIPPGEFMMGAPDSASDARPSEKPQHRVRITRPFYLGISAVTQQEYEAVTGTNPSANRGPRIPVDHVSWHDANNFCNLLREREQSAGLYRLPTEAEWEYACRAGTQTQFPWGDDEASADEYCWFAANSGGRTQPVCQKKPNAFGLFDMLGNIREMCSDNSTRNFAGDNYYADSPRDDPQGIAAGNYRIWRGGGFYSPRPDKSYTRSDGYPPTTRNDSVGFRVLLETRRELSRQIRERADMRTPSGTPPSEPLASVDPANALNSMSAGFPREPRNAPDRPAIDKAQALFDQVYAKRYEEIIGKPAPARFDSLAKLAREARSLAEEEADPAMKYVALESAVHWAIESGDADVTWEFIDDMARRFQIDDLSLRIEAVKSWYDLIQKHFRGGDLLQKRRRLVELIVPLAERASQECYFGESAELYDLAAGQSGGQSSRQVELRKAAHAARLKQQHHEKMLIVERKLRNADDPKKHLELGRYLCLQLQRWEHGLPHLAKGSDEALRTAASLDLAGGGTTEQKVAIGDAWWGLADDLEGDGHEAIRKRAEHWYTPAVGQLTGLEKKRIEQRLSDIRGTPHTGSPWIDLPALIDPRKHSVSGSWKVMNGEIGIENAGRAARITIPFLPDDEYDLQLQFTRMGKSAGIVLPIMQRPCLFGLTSDVQLELFQRPQGNPGSGRQDNADGERHQIDIRVRRADGGATVEADLNGVPAVRWTGSLDEVKMYSAWDLGDNTKFGLVAGGGTTVLFHQVRYRAGK